MNLLISCNTKFLLDRDGELWTPNGAFEYRFWTRYLAVFDEVRLLARAQACAEVPPGWHRATGSGIKAAPLADFRSLWTLAKQYPATQRVIRKTLVEAPAVIIRAPSLVGAWSVVGKSGRPYGLEVVGDPYDTFSPGASGFWLRPCYRWWFARSLRQECTEACATAYVTESCLQRRYPPATGVFTTHYSSIYLTDEALACVPRTYEGGPTRLELIMVGMLTTLYKGGHVLIDAVARCVQDGIDLHMTFVGGGKHQRDHERRVQRAGIESRISFLGHISSRQALQEQLDRSDLFILPSFQEGLPRAMIEAMARGLPCIGSTVGGIPELLPPEDLVPPGDATLLAAKIREVATDPLRMTRMSARNLAKAGDYRDEVLRERRRALYRHVRDCTGQWLLGRQEAFTE